MISIFVHSSVTSDNTYTRLVSFVIITWKIYFFILAFSVTHVCLYMSLQGKYVLLTMRSFDIAKLMVTTPLPLDISFKLSRPIMGLYLVSRLNCALKFPIIILITFLDKENFLLLQRKHFF